MMISKIAVLIPCYNEAQTIREVIRDYRAALPEADIFVYDNNSSDGTDVVARSEGAIVMYERRQGKGHVIRSMFRDIDAECYIMTDGDDTYPASRAAEMARLVLEEGADMVIGDRLSSTYFTENKRAFHNAGNLLVRKLVNSFFHGNIEDIMTGSRAFSPIFVKSFPVLTKGFEIETEMTIHALDKKLAIRTVQVDYRDRPAGSTSKLSTFRDGFKVLKTVARLFKNYRPLAFFSWLAVLLIVIGAIFFVPVLIEFVKTGLVPKLPTMVSSLVLWVIAVILFSNGLILDTIAQNAKQQFEVQLNIIKLLMRRD